MKKKIIISIILAALLCNMAVPAYADSSGNFSSGNLLNAGTQMADVSDRAITITNEGIGKAKDARTTINSNLESGGTDIGDPISSPTRVKTFSLEKNVREFIGDEVYRRTGTAFYDLGSGRGVSYVKIKDSNMDSMLPFVPASASIPRYTELKQGYDTSPTLNNLMQLYHASPTGNSHTVYVPANEAERLAVAGNTIRVWTGYSPAIESKDERLHPIVQDESSLTSEGQDMYKNSGEYDTTPYPNVFGVDDKAVIEDSYILIRKLLDVDNNHTDGLPSAREMSDISTCENSGALRNAKIQARNIKTAYERERESFTDCKTTDNISRLLNAPGRPIIRDRQYGYFNSDGIRTGTNWSKYNHDLASWMQSVINDLDYPPDYSISIPVPNSSPSYSSTIDSYRNDLVTKIRQDDGSFQRDARKEYNNTNASQYQRYINAIDMFDTGNGALEFDANRPSDTDIETDNFSTEDDTEALLWYLWLTYGWTDIPSGVKVRTVTDFIGDRSISEPILAFRTWLIRKEIYLNDSWSSGNGYTLNKDMWNDGELLTYWLKVYGSGYGDCIENCISPYERKYPDEFRELTGRSNNNMNDDLYPYLEGYTNASYIPYNPRKVEDYSVFDNAVTLLGKLGLNGGQNIPPDKWIDLGFYTDVQVVKYSNDSLIKTGVYDRYEWYVYYNPNGNDRNGAEVVFHDSSTSRDCPYTAIAEGYYWVECYQSGYSTYVEKYTYNKTNFLVEEITGTVLMTSFVPQIQTRTNTITLPEKVQLLSEEAGYLNNNSMTWRAQNGRIIASFNTERRSDLR